MGGGGGDEGTSGASANPALPPPPVQPTTLWHPRNTAAAWQSPRCTRAGAWSIRCPCDCEVCPLCNSACFPTSATKLQKVVQNSSKIRKNFVGKLSEMRTKFVPTNAWGKCPNSEVSMGLVRNSYKIRKNFCEFVRNVYRLRSVAPMAVASALPLPRVLPPILCFCL